MAGCCRTTSTARNSEDAARRDFTINALYYDPATEEVWDYVGGVADVRARRLKLIGPPVTRYREDPVRMLRAVRLAAKLGVAIDPKTAAPIPSLAPLIQNVPPARLFDEMQKLLLSGHAAKSVKSLREHGLHHGLLPLLDVILEQPLGPKFIDAALAGTDERVREDKPVSPAFLFATLLWHEVLVHVERRQKRPARKPLPALFDAMDRVLGAVGRAHRHSAALRGHDQGNLVAAAALRAARRFSSRTGCSSIRAFAPPTTSWRFAAKAARFRWRWSTGGRGSRTRANPSARRC